MTFDIETTTDGEFRLTITNDWDESADTTFATIEEAQDAAEFGADVMASSFGTLAPWEVRAAIIFNRSGLVWC